MLDKSERAIRVLEVEAEMNEEQAKRFAELASYVNGLEHKLKLETLSAEALQKAVALRIRIRNMRKLPRIESASYHSIEFPLSRTVSGNSGRSVF